MTQKGLSSVGKAEREQLAPSGKEWILNVHRTTTLEMIQERWLQEWGFLEGWRDFEIVPTAVGNEGRIIPWQVAVYGRKVVRP